MKARKLKPKTSRTTSSPRETAFKKGEQQAVEGYQMVMPRYKTKSECESHYRGYAKGAYSYAMRNTGKSWLNKDWRI